MDVKDGSEAYQLFVKQHLNQLKSSDIPDIYWYSLYIKLKKQIFDAGDSFIIAKIADTSDTCIMVCKDGGVQGSDCNAIYLIDHAWTFEAQNAELNLRSVPNLLQRMANIMTLNAEDYSTDEELLNAVKNGMWKYAQTYSCQLNPAEPPTPLWYILDEFGSIIRHSSSPNFRVVPFFYLEEAIAYSLLFPIRDVDVNEEVTRDYLEGIARKDEAARAALLTPWTGETFSEEHIAYFEPDDSYFRTGAELEIILEEAVPMPKLSPTLKVFSEYPLVSRYLQRPGFVMVDDEEEADVLWLTRHFKNFKQLAETRPGTFINQFPCERVITTKDLLSIVVRKVASSAKWFPLTFNLNTETAAFVATYQKRERENMDNHWICKPWNLARALDTTVTDNLPHILRLPFTGPKIVQKYIENPVLYNRPDVGKVKFDIRYVILVQSVSPLKLFTYKEFFLRFANRPFELADLWDYERHFTVMNYREDSELHEVRKDQFEEEWTIQYPNHPWDEIQEGIFQIFRDVFTAASASAPPRGMASWPQSRAVYAADLMLSWNQDNRMQPMLLEINFAPDCERACRYYPEFYDELFGLLFKGEIASERFNEL